MNILVLRLHAGLNYNGKIFPLPEKVNITTCRDLYHQYMKKRLQIVRNQSYADRIKDSDREINNNNQ